MYELDKIHVVVDALSRLPNIIEPLGVRDQTTCASLFYMLPE
jgi:hypothetical protein